MKKNILFLTMVLMLIGQTVNAKNWTFKMGGVRSVSFEIPDDYECDSVNNEQFLFMKDGVVLSVEVIALDNFNQKKAKTIPDSILVPNTVIINREEPSEGPVSRIIMSKHDDGSTIRHYIFFNPRGVIIMGAYTPNCDWKETDKIAKTFESHFKWGKFLLVVLVMLIGMIPGMIISLALDYRKENLQKFWGYCVAALLMIIAFAIVLSIWWSMNFWVLLCVYLLVSVALGYFFKHGGVIVI